MKKRKPACLRSFGLFCLVVILGAGGRPGALPGTEKLSTDASGSRYEQPKALEGGIYARDTRQLLFKFRREATNSGGILKVRRDFSYPDGRLAARERVVYDRDALVSYQLEEAQIGASGSARIRRSANDPARGQIDFEYTSAPGSRPKLHSDTLRDNTLIADMVGPFLLEHWDALQRGEKVKCRYIVVPRTETVGFTFVRVSELTREGRRLLVVRMEATSPFISALVDPLLFTIEQAPPHRVLEYAGRTTPKLQVGGKWKDLDAVTVFDWKSSK